MTSRPLPWRVSLWIWRHRTHGPIRLNRHISVPGFDPGALGILASCPCGKVGAW